MTAFPAATLATLATLALLGLGAPPAAADATAKRKGAPDKFAKAAGG